MQKVREMFMNSNEKPVRNDLGGSNIENKESTDRSFTDAAFRLKWEDISHIIITFSQYII